MERRARQKREMKYTFNLQNLPSEESHPVTHPLGEKSRNPAKKQEKILYIQLLLHIE